MRDFGAPSPKGVRHCAWANVLLRKLLSMQSKLGWFAKFCACARESSFIVSVNLNDLLSSKSTCINLGPLVGSTPRWVIGITKTRTRRNDTIAGVACAHIGNGGRQTSKPTADLVVVFEYSVSRAAGAVYGIDAGP